MSKGPDRTNDSTRFFFWFGVGFRFFWAAELCFPLAKLHETACHSLKLHLIVDSQANDLTNGHGQTYPQSPQGRMIDNIRYQVHDGER